MFYFLILQSCSYFPKIKWRHTRGDRLWYTLIESVPNDPLPPLFWAQKIVLFQLVLKMHSLSPNFHFGAEVLGIIRTIFLITWIKRFGQAIGFAYTLKFTFMPYLCRHTLMRQLCRQQACVPRRVGWLSKGNVSRNWWRWVFPQPLWDEHGFADFRNANMDWVFMVDKEWKNIGTKCLFKMWMFINNAHYNSMMS